jgi:hypothetical protein
VLLFVCVLSIYIYVYCMAVLALNSLITQMAEAFYTTEPTSSDDYVCVLQRRCCGESCAKTTERMKQESNHTEHETPRGHGCARGHPCSTA